MSDLQSINHANLETYCEVLELEYLDFEPLDCNAESVEEAEAMAGIYIVWFKSADGVECQQFIRHLTDLDKFSSVV